jgi:2-dehydropantoate 2-reductase
MLRESGRETVTRPDAVTSVAGLAPFDLVLLSVRTFDVAAALPDVARVVGRSGVLLALQNGVGTEEEIARFLGRDRILAGTLTVRPGVDEPGLVTRYSTSGGVALSTLDGRPVPHWVVEAFASTGLPASAVADYRSLRWSKLLLNMLGAASTAILDIDMPDLVRDGALFRLEQLAFREAGRVVDALGARTVSLPGYPVPLARLAMRLPRPLAQPLIGPRLAGARGGQPPGMKADLQRGRTEIETLNGAVVREAARLRIPAPVNAALTELTLDLTAHGERRAAFRRNPDALLAYARARGARV